MNIVKSLLVRAMAISLSCAAALSVAAEIQYPWMQNGTGTLFSDQYMNPVVGYDFTPQVDGEVVQLGGYFNGTRLLRLYDHSTGALLAEVQATAANNWRYVDIVPVAVQAGTRYTAAVVGNHSGGGTFQTGNDFPMFPASYGDVTINAAVSGFAEQWPLDEIPGAMYGLVDIGFFNGSIGTGSAIGVEPAALSFTATAGDINPAGQAVAITNLGSGVLDWVASSTATWLNIAPTTGTAPASLAVAVDITGLAAGSYRDDIIITDVNDSTITLSLPVSLTLLSDPTVVQTPWRSNETGSSLTTDLRWGNYTMGYQFTPQIDGRIINLAGFFNGKKKVRLYHTASAAILAEATVSAANNWVAVDITPVPVSAGVSYTVAVVHAGSGGSFRTGAGFPLMPQRYGDITIQSSVWDSGKAMPVTEVQSAMYGQADVGFLPGQ